MSAIDRAIAANQNFTVNYDPEQVSPRPRLKLAILTCMDTRISYRALGLEPGDVHMIRNAGGIVTDDALRSIFVSHYLLGTEELMIINHTDCGLMKASEEELHATIEAKAGVWPNYSDSLSCVQRRGEERPRADQQAEVAQLGASQT